MVVGGNPYVLAERLELLAAGFVLLAKPSKVMNNLFLFLLLVSLVALPVGLVKPSWVRLDSRKRVSKIMGGSILAFFILFAITSDSTPEELATSQNTPVVETKAEATAQVPSKPASLEEQITQAVTNALGSTNNTNKPRVVSVKVSNYNSVELSAYGYKPTDTVKGVLVTINASENLTTNLQKGTMADEAVKIFQAVFPLSSQIGDVGVWSQLPVKDKYGNTKDDTAITFVMTRPLYQKVNWSNFNHRDLPTLLNSESRIDDRNGSHELIKF